MMYTYDSQDVHTQMMQCVDDEQLEGSGFQFDRITEIIIEFYKTHNIKASSYIELPRN